VLDTAQISWMGQGPQQPGRVQLPSIQFFCPTWLWQCRTSKLAVAAGCCDFWGNSLETDDGCCGPESAQKMTSMGQSVLKKNNHSHLADIRRAGRLHRSPRLHVCLVRNHARQHLHSLKVLEH